MTLTDDELQRLSTLVRKHGLAAIVAGLVKLAGDHQRIRDRFLASNWNAAEKILNDAQNQLHNQCPEV